MGKEKMMKNQKNETRRAKRVKITENIILQEFEGRDEVPLDEIVNRLLDIFARSYEFYTTARTVKGYIDSVVRRKNITNKITEE